MPQGQAGDKTKYSNSVCVLQELTHFRHLRKGLGYSLIHNLFLLMFRMKKLKRSVCTLGLLRDTSQFLLMIVSCSLAPLLRIICVKAEEGKWLLLLWPSTRESISFTYGKCSPFNSCLGQSSLTGPLGRNISKQWSVFQTNGRKPGLVEQK